MLKEKQGISYSLILNLLLCIRRKVIILTHLCQALEALDLQLQENYIHCIFTLLIYLTH